MNEINKAQTQAPGFFLLALLPVPASLQPQKLAALGKQARGVQEAGRTEKSTLTPRSVTAKSNAELCKDRRCSLPFLTRRDLFYSLLYFLKTDIYNSHP